MRIKCPKCKHEFNIDPAVSVPASGIPPTHYSKYLSTLPKEPIRCIDCGVIISQYEHYYTGTGIEGWGYRDTVERAGSADSLRCGKCYDKYWKDKGYK